MRKTNQEQPFHPIYNYALVTDAEEGLILVDVNTLADGEPRNNFLKRAATWNEGGVLKGARHLTHRRALRLRRRRRGHRDPRPGRSAQAAARRRSCRLQARERPRSSSGIFSSPTGRDSPRSTSRKPRSRASCAGSRVALADARRIYVARTYAYVAAGREGLAIIDVEKPEAPKLMTKFTADGKLNDARDVIVGSTNASAFAYVADGKNGLKVIQLTSPESQPKFYGFSPEPRPHLIAWRETASPAIALAKGLDRDRAVDETGGQIAVFGRIGSRPFTREEQERFYLRPDGIGVDGGG